jgi:hypothetical protein
MLTRIAIFGVTALAFLLRHWAAIFYLVLVALIAFVFAPRGNFDAMVALAIVGAGVAVGHWWV